MNPSIALQVFLVLHLSGLALMLGTSVVEFFTFRVCCRLIVTDAARSGALLELMEKLSALLAVGAAMLILSGTGMIVLTRGVFLHQLWLQVKFVLVLLLILNGFLVGARHGRRLRNTLQANGMTIDKTTKGAIRNLEGFYSIQLAIYLAIIVVSIFRFS